MTVREAFIEKALLEYMRMTKSDMAQAFRQQNVGETNAALRSIDDKVSGTTGELSFKEYIRFVDMGVGRGQPLGGLKMMKTTLKSSTQSGYALEKNRGRKAKKVYSKKAYGNLSWLQGKILFGYSEEAIRIIKEELEAANG